jgi:hypothetical protein
VTWCDVMSCHVMYGLLFKTNLLPPLLQISSFFWNDRHRSVPFKLTKSVFRRRGVRQSHHTTSFPRNHIPNIHYSKNFKSPVQFNSTWCWIYWEKKAVLCNVYKPKVAWTTNASCDGTFILKCTKPINNYLYLNLSKLHCLFLCGTWIMYLSEELFKN